MKQLKVKVIVERGSDGKYSAYMDYYKLDFGLSGFGDTAKAAMADFHEAFEQEKRMCAAEGKQPPELEFDIRYDMSSFLDYFAGILSKSGIEKITGINQKQLWHYSSGNRKPKSQTVHKIQERLHHFGKELQQLKFTTD
ncbi:MAG: DNA-binding protein [Prevotellaceae bacterium]|jgi:hypothetical protein|nr:DNA-binding protein [Prevotellaceae bacterium]